MDHEMDELRVKITEKDEEIKEHKETIEELEKVSVQISVNLLAIRQLSFPAPTQLTPNIFLMTTFIWIASRRVKRDERRRW